MIIIIVFSSIDVLSHETDLFCHMKPLFLSTALSTRSVRPDSSILEKIPALSGIVQV